MPPSLLLAMTLAAIPRGDCLERLGPVPQPFDAVAHALCDDLSRGSGVGAVVAMASQGMLRLTLSAGQRCIDQPDTVTSTTPFRIGSITKLVTAALVLVDQERGWLALDEPITAHALELERGLVGLARTITIRHLLMHTSGLADVYANPDTAKLPSHVVLDLLAPAVPRTTPGTLWNYSNTGYYVAGIVLERRGGASYPELVQRDLVDRLALEHTTAVPEEAVEMDAACGHVRDEHGRWRSLTIAQDFEELALGSPWTIPAGGIVASADDLVRLVLALTDPRDGILDVRSVLEMTTGDLNPHLSPGQRAALSAAWRPLADGSKLFHHTGMTGDFSAELSWVPERGVAVAVLANTALSMKTTVNASLRAMGIETIASTATIDPVRTRAYVGHYRSADPPFELDVTDDEQGHVSIDAPALNWSGAPLTYIDGDRFWVRPSGQPSIELTFIVDRRTGTLLRTRTFVATRTR